MVATLSDSGNGSDSDSDSSPSDHFTQEDVDDVLSIHDDDDKTNVLGEKDRYSKSDNESQDAAGEPFHFTTESSDHDELSVYVALAKDLLHKNKIGLLFVFLVTITCIVLAAVYSNKKPTETTVTEVALEDLQAWAKSQSDCLVYESFNVTMVDGEPVYVLECLPVILTWKSFLTIFLVAVSFISMANDAPPEIPMLIITVLFVVFGIISEKEAWTGFSNEGVVAVGVLYGVAGGVESTGVVDLLARYVIGSPKNVRIAMARLIIPACLLSVFLNNTPLVAVLMPITISWAKRIQMSASTFLMPLSFGIMLAGTISVVGTSTNLVLMGIVEERTPEVKFTFFAPAAAGIPITIIGILYFVILAPYVPNRVKPDEAASSNIATPRYKVSFSVKKRSRLIGETVDSSGLLVSDDVRLVRLNKEGSDLSDGKWAMDTVIELGDQLHFESTADGVVYLRSFTNFLVDARVDLFTHGRKGRALAEVVLSPHSYLAGRPMDPLEFFDSFKGVPLGVKSNKISHPEIEDDHEVLRAGDCLLVEASIKTLKKYSKDNTNFSLVHVVPDSRPPLLFGPVVMIRMALAGFGMLAVIILAAVSVTTIQVAGVFFCLLMVLTGIMTVKDIFAAIKGRTLLAIVVTFGMGAALENTGVAKVVAEGLVNLMEPLGAGGVLAAIALVSAFGTSILSNNAVVVVMIPIVINAHAQTPYISLLQYYIVIMVCASIDLMTPIGYQTNLMVYGPGKYRFYDYTLFGGPLEMVCLAVTVIAVVLFVP